MLVVPITIPPIRVPACIICLGPFSCPLSSRSVLVVIWPIGLWLLTPFRLRFRLWLIVRAFASLATIIISSFASLATVIISTLASLAILPTKSTLTSFARLVLIIIPVGLWCRLWIGI
jgi:hypothetical protein